jgi:hypothetical protein
MKQKRCNPETNKRMDASALHGKAKGHDPDSMSASCWGAQAFQHRSAAGAAPSPQLSSATNRLID